MATEIAKPMLKPLVATLIILAPFLSWSQEQPKNRTLPVNEHFKETLTRHKQHKANAEKQIKDLRNGALLVRLRTKEKSIKALREVGWYSMADKIEQKQADLNQEIVTAFTYFFDFCPTYFFYSHHSNNIKNKEFEKVEFLNEKMELDTSIHFNEKAFLTAEFGTLDLDTARHSGGLYRGKTEEGYKTSKYYVRKSNLQFGALSIKSDEFVQLRDPFPFYVRTFPINDYKLLRSPEFVVEKMNEKLYFYYRNK